MLADSHNAPPPALAALDIVSLLERHPNLQIERDEYNINVTSGLGEAISSDSALNLIEAHDGANKPAHVYFHVPLCAYLCDFCNYVKRLMPTGPGAAATVDRWTALLIEESSRYLRSMPWYARARVESVYLGGGTAAVLGPRNLSALLDHVSGNYSLSSDCEISLEGNPDNFQHDEARRAITHGFNRFSVGVQSLQDSVNDFTGRKHSSAMSLRAIDALLETNKPFNVDMMFGLPHQTPTSVRQDIQTLAARRVPTITIYRLRNADRAKMGIGVTAKWNVPLVRLQMQSAGLFPTLNETYLMRNEAVDVLMSSGYRPSPCGWWSLPDVYDGGIPRVSRNKWERYDSMLAFGPGAYGWISGGTNQILQTHNDTNITRHASLLETSTALPLASGRLLRGREAVATVLGFAFKAFQPISLERFRRQFDVDLLADEPYATVLRDMIAADFIRLSVRDTLTPTLTGEALHEEIIFAFFHRRLGADGGLCKRLAAAC